MKRILTNKTCNKILRTVTQSVTNVPQTNNTNTSGMNEEQCENIARNNQSPVFDSIMSIVVPNFSQIGGFLYFGGHFGFKMATIANRNGRNMDTPCKYPFPLKSFHF